MQESLKKVQHNIIENVAGSVWLSLFMDGNVKWKLPSTPPSTGLSRIQHLKWTGTILNFETSADVFIWRLSWNLQCITISLHLMLLGTLIFNNLFFSRHEITKLRNRKSLLVWFTFPSCTDSIKPSLQFLRNFVVINASEGSLCFQIFKCV
jgi:hypothetical protein